MEFTPQNYVLHTVGKGLEVRFCSAETFQEAHPNKLLHTCSLQFLITEAVVVPSCHSSLCRG
jgi:hypothetical protein